MCALCFAFTFSGVVAGLLPLVDVLHLLIDLADGVGAQAQPGGVLVGELPVGLVAQLVLQTGPHVHGDGAQLNLHRQHHGTLGDDDGHVHHQMQAAVAGWLGLLDVIHLPDDPERLEPGQQRAEVVDIVHVIADNADPRQILYVGVDVVDGHIVAPAPQLIHDAVQRLDAVLDVVDGRMVVHPGEFLVQYLHLRHSHLQGAAVQMGHAHHPGSQRLLLRRQVPGHRDIPQPDAAALFDHHGQCPPSFLMRAS